MEEEQEESVEVREGANITTAHKHYYEEGETHGDLKDVICSCGHGHQINKDLEVRKGKILWKS